MPHLIAYLDRHRWGKVIDTGWSHWDMRVYCHPWTAVEVCTAHEDHGGGKRLIRVRYRLRASGYVKALAWTGAVAVPAALALQALGTAAAGAALLAVAAGLWWRGSRRARRALAVFDAAAAQLGLLCCQTEGGASCP